jgi:uncharacterized protein YndB with AHSA1/START domain
MRSIAESIEVACAPERLFQTLHTPTEICLWWNARTAVVAPRPLGLWVAAWGKDEDQPDYITKARLKVFDPPRRLVLGEFEYWASGESLPFAHLLETEFCIEPANSGARLTVTQTGFPDDPTADEFYAGCCRGWKVTLDAIRDFF